MQSSHTPTGARNAAAQRFAILSSAALVAASLAGCATAPGTGTASARMERIRNVVVIYAENHSFDNMYGLFPGANGIPGVNPTRLPAMCRKRISTAAPCRSCRRPGAA